MINVSSILEFGDIGIDEEWNDSKTKEMSMHSIHAYPAKFPAFIAAKAFDFAKEEGVHLGRVADVFCGCGTVALEARLHDLDFWGCDINPVATLIAKAKSNNYNIKIMQKHYTKIIDIIDKIQDGFCDYENANERLRYWFTKNSFETLYKIKYAIDIEIKTGKYREAFLCIFSSILKASSRWLTKSIKPQVDPNKREINVLEAFEQQYNKFIKAIEETKCEKEPTIDIKCHNFLNAKNVPLVDLVITSPPYVTSYEYADLHQLSSLWLGYAEDYRDLRRGTIGSVYNSDTFSFDIKELNFVGQDIVGQLLSGKKMTSKVKSVARYYVDIQHAITRCFSMLNNNGMAFFVVGDTEYKEVKIENSKHLVQSLIDNGFIDVKIGKRKISNKLLTPYRDSSGKFTSDKTQRSVYHEEFIISGRKANE